MNKLICLKGTSAKTILFILSILFHFSFCIAQQYKTAVDRIDLNLGFENGTQVNGLPLGWSDWGHGYKVQVDTSVKHGGHSSARIEPSSERIPNSFGFIVQSLESNFAAKEIELRAYLKLSNVAAGSVGLVLRLDGPSGAIALENMSSRNIAGTRDWQEYSIKLGITEAVRTIHFGASLSGTGQLWVDDIQILWDGNDINEAIRKEPKVYGAESDHEFDNGSKLGEFSLADANIERLATLGKVWGFLKYYHPAIARGDYNWDYELFRILPRILKAKNSTEFNSILYDWIPGLGQAAERQDADTAKAEIKLSPDFSWMNEALLGRDLTFALQNIKAAQRTYENYYADRVRLPKSWRFSHEHPYYQKYNDIGYRLLSLYRYWNVIAYFFPYRYLIDEDWNSVLEEFIPIFIKAKNETDYVLAALSIIARIHDTHANIWGHNDALNRYKGERYAPFKVRFVENKAIVSEYFINDIGGPTKIKIGDVINTINGVSVDELIASRSTLTPASNYPTKLRDLARDLLRTNDTTLNIGYSSGSKRSNLRVRTYPPDALGIYMNQDARDTCFKMLNSKIAYIFPGSIKNKYLPDIMREVQKSKGLIVDFRCYPSEPIMQTLTSYLSPQSTPFVKFSMPHISTPGLFTIKLKVNAGANNPEYFKGKVVIIIDERTQSQAEFTTMALRTAPKATVIGSTTAGADGDMCWLYLPGGIETAFSGVGVYYPDGRETQRIGIVPDIEVKPTIKGIRNGRDELLERAIKIIND